MHNVSIVVRRFSVSEQSVCPVLICSLVTGCLQILSLTVKEWREITLRLCATEREKAICLGLNEAAVYLSASL